MSFLRSLLTDLRERQVLPAVLLLVVLVIAIPAAGVLVLSKTPATGPVVVPPVDAAPPHGEPAPFTALATIQTPPAQHYVVFKGTEQNPLRLPATPKAATTTKPSSGTTSRSGASTSQPVTSPPSSSPAPASSKPKTQTSPRSLASDEVYTVNVSTTYGSQTDTLDDVERLTPLPANVTPEVVFLGVMKGGKSAAFLLTGSVPVSVSAPADATCEPSATSCQVVELPLNSSLNLTPDPANSAISMFSLSVSAIGVARLGSAAAATQARESAAAAGEAIISASTSAGLASFFYDEGLGALIYEPQSGATGSSGTSGSSGATGASGSSGATSTP